MIKFAQLKDIVGFLNALIEIDSIEDSSVNGLQVGKDGEIKRIGFAVDACMETFEKARDNHCDLLVVHHGMFWKKNETITGFMYERIKFLTQNNIAVYAVHLPLDKHPAFGNNAVLAREFGLKDISPLGEKPYKDVCMQGTLEYEKPFDSLVRDIKSKLNSKITALPFGPTSVKKIAICSGGGAFMILDAIKEGCDTFITGEPAHGIVHTAKESGINAIFAGHYATETVGVKALAAEVKQKFDVEVGFIDVPTGL